MGSKTSLSRKAVLAQFPLINSPSFFPFHTRENFLLLLLDKTLVMETAHISFFPSHICGSGVLRNANGIPSEEGGKKQNKTKQPTKQEPPPNFEHLLSDSLPSQTPLPNQDCITEKVFQLSTPATTEII